MYDAYALVAEQLEAQPKLVALTALADIGETVWIGTDDGLSPHQSYFCLVAAIPSRGEEGSFVFRR
jgi:hypothetical protein